MAETDTDKEKPPSVLPQAAKAHRDPTRRVKDVIQSGNLWPDLPRRELEDILDTDLVIEDFSYMSGKFGKFAVLLLRMPGTTQQFTSACGGEVVCRKLDELKDGRHLPVLGTINYNERYYDLV